MPNVRELLEREGATVDLELGHFERMLRRRDGTKGSAPARWRSLSLW